MTGSSVHPETNDEIMIRTIAEKMTGQMDIVAVLKFVPAMEVFGRFTAVF